MLVSVYWSTYVATDCNTLSTEVAIDFQNESISGDVSSLRIVPNPTDDATESLGRPQIIPRSFSPWSDMSSVSSEMEESPTNDLDSRFSVLAMAKDEVEQFLDH